MTGFGDPGCNYWLGLEHLHLIIGMGDTYKLKVELEFWSGEIIQLEYSIFSVGDKQTNYSIVLGGFVGNASFDALSCTSGQQFSIEDCDNTENCDGSKYGGGWWYSDHCTYTGYRGDSMKDKHYNPYNY